MHRIMSHEGAARGYEIRVDISQLTVGGTGTPTAVRVVTPTEERNFMQLTTASAYRRPCTSANGHLQIEMDSLGTFRRYDADETVYCQGGEADYWYRIVQRTARQCTQISYAVFCFKK